MLPSALPSSNHNQIDIQVKREKKRKKPGGWGREEDAYWWRRRRRGGLATELDRLLEMARELEVRVERGSPATARDLCAALAASVDNAVRLAGTGTPRGGGAIGGKLRRKRGAMEKVRRQVRVSSVHDLAPLDDGLSWRKYGQKDILGAKYPRSQFTAMPVILI